MYLMTTTNLGPRPSNPEEISFADECFAIDGCREEFVVVLSAPSYPAKFDTREAAEAFARKTGRVVTVRSKPIRRRVRWY